MAIQSWFGRVNYDYQGRYLFEASLRADGSSRFAEGHRWGYSLHFLPDGIFIVRNLWKEHLPGCPN